MNLPTTTAHVCRCPRRLSHAICPAAGSGASLRICVSSAAERRGCASGLRYSASQSTSQRNPRLPVATKAQRHPNVNAIQGTTSGVTIAPVFVPALKIPVASARSFFGNHSATALIAPGKLADSPSPKSAGVADGGDAPGDDRHGEPAPHPYPVEPSPDHEKADRVQCREPGDDVAVARLGPVQLPLQRGRENAQDLPVDVVDGRDDEQEGADSPAVAGPPHLTKSW